MFENWNTSSTLLVERLQSDPRSELCKHGAELYSVDMPSHNPDFYVFAEDVEFSSPSAGAACVNAGNSNGRTNWKVADTGETYQQWHDKKLAAAGSIHQATDE